MPYPFPFLNLSVSCKAEAYHWLAPLQGDHTMYILLIKHVTGHDVCHLIPDSTIPSLCLAHCMAIVNVAVTVFYDILMCSVKQHDMAPCNLIIWLPKNCSSAPFCQQEQCPIHCSVDPDNAKSVMIDIEESRPQVLQ
ncbi:hypothetical protein EDD18DRAFT_1362354 [Armillaria luteobubalina]|uniref:Uncharacterized protein n=1 Tax=Armillaria luteobubalina TaxID=153913 RepID=A0AA39UKU6_9AGAR|nr:hypothetical protein EDD18DRAFT_1362354 [Armillaria luteobubalina]